MKIVNTVILSGACCNPLLSDLDRKIQARIEEVSDKKDIQVNIQTISISSAAIGGLGLGKDVGDAVRKLLSSMGMSALPIIIFNGAVAFYGGLASVKLVEEKLNLAAQQ